MMCKVAIIGGGPAGLMCAITAGRNNPFLDITIFDKKDIGHTILPTGGGRCNLSHYSDDIRAFAQNYPRGEKFLYGIFNKFFIEDTIDFFNSIGVKTYIQPDERIFPVSNKSLDVIFALKNEVKRLNIEVKNVEIKDFEYKNDKFIVNGENFDKLVIATGGKHSFSLFSSHPQRHAELVSASHGILYSLINLGHNIIEQKPALCGLEIKEKYYQNISGVSLKDIQATVKTNKTTTLQGDLLFTHKGISGPLAYKISSLFLNKEYSYDNPLEISLDFINSANRHAEACPKHRISDAYSADNDNAILPLRSAQCQNDDKFNLQELLNKNSKKKVNTLLAEFMPKSFAEILLKQNNLNDKFCHEIVKNERKILEMFLTELKINVIGALTDNVIVSSGGIDLKEINSKNMESKIIKNLYFCGEVVDIDGFCGGYNLQNCWSTGYVAGMSL